MKTDIIVDLILFFVIGTLIGSFLSVIISRMSLNKKGIIGGRSECPECHHKLSALNLIPIFSWIFQGGKCQYCKKPISFSYPLLELSSGLLLVAAYFYGHIPRWDMPSFQLFFEQYTTYQVSTLYLWIRIIYAELLNIILLLIAFYDFKTKKIPNLFLVLWILLTTPLFLYKIVYLLQHVNYWDNPLGYLSPVAGLLTNLVLMGGQWFLSKGKWLGSGDVIFSIGMAFLFRFQKNLLAIFLSYMVGTIVAVLLLSSGRAERKTAIPFAPFLVFGTLITIYFGDNLIKWYLGIFNF